MVFIWKLKIMWGFGCQHPNPKVTVVICHWFPSVWLWVCWRHLFGFQPPQQPFPELNTHPWEKHSSRWHVISTRLLLSGLRTLIFSLYLSLYNVFNRHSILCLLPNYSLQEGRELPSLLLSEIKLTRISVRARNMHNAIKIQSIYRSISQLRGAFSVLSFLLLT